MSTFLHYYIQGHIRATAQTLRIPRTTPPSHFSCLFVYTLKRHSVLAPLVGAVAMKTRFLGQLYKFVLLRHGLHINHINFTGSFTYTVIHSSIYSYVHPADFHVAGTVLCTRDWD